MKTEPEFCMLESGGYINFSKITLNQYESNCKLIFVLALGLRDPLTYHYHILQKCGTTMLSALKTNYKINPPFNL